MSFILLISKKGAQGYKGVMFSNLYRLAQLKMPHTLHYALITPLHPNSTVAVNPARSVTPLADCRLRRERGTGTMPRPTVTAPPARRNRLEAHRRPSKPRRPPPVTLPRPPVRLPQPSARETASAVRPGLTARSSGSRPRGYPLEFWTPSPLIRA